MKNESNRRKRILCVHQGAELYGSDRSFLQAVEALRRQWPDADIRIVLAMDGPLRERLERFATHVEVRSLFVLRLADKVQTLLKGTIGLPYYLLRAWLDLRGRDLVYINTTVVADYMIAARLARCAVIHAREIPKPKAMPVIEALCRFSCALIIFNSKATREAFDLAQGQEAAIVYNGAEPIARASAPDCPPAFSPDRPLRIALLGRINDWKGQDLLIEAIARLPREDRARLHARIVGGTFRDVQEPIVHLRSLIDRHGLQECVTIEPFSDDPDAIYQWCDLCAVPSRLPEPFGRVAIEAMAWGRPVVAAGHGGLVEIVDDASGWTFPPNDADALAGIIGAALQAPETVKAKGKAALDRFLAVFSVEKTSARLVEIIRGFMSGRP